MVLLFIFRKDQKNIDNICDERELTPSDYSLFVKGIPKGKEWNYTQELTHFFTETYLKSKNIPFGQPNFDYEVVKEVNLVYKIDTLDDLFKKQKKMINEKRA